MEGREGRTSTVTPGTYSISISRGPSGSDEYRLILDFDNIELAEGRFGPRHYDLHNNVAPDRVIYVPAEGYEGNGHGEDVELAEEVVTEYDPMAERIKVDFRGLPDDRGDAWRRGVAGAMAQYLKALDAWYCDQEGRDREIGSVSPEAINAFLGDDAATVGEGQSTTDQPTTS